MSRVKDKNEDVIKYHVKLGDKIDEVISYQNIMDIIYHNLHEYENGYNNERMYTFNYIKSQKR